MILREDPRNDPTTRCINKSMDPRKDCIVLARKDRTTDLQKDPCGIIDGIFARTPSTAFDKT